MNLPPPQNPECIPGDLEALCRGELSPERAERVEAHAATCPSCHKELMWLRVEKDMVLRRREGQLESVKELWPAVARRLEEAERRRRRSWVLQPASWMSAAAVAASVVVGAFAYQHGWIQVNGHGRQSLGGMRGAELPEIPEPPEPPELPGLPGAHEETAELSRAVKGPITLYLETLAADVEVAAGGPAEVRMKVAGVGRLALVERAAGALAAAFDGDSSLRSGHLSVAVPPGSHLHVSTTSGEIELRATGGQAHIRTASGDVSLSGAAEADIRTASGDVHAEDVPRLLLETASGDLDYLGRCAKGCRITGRSASGEAHLSLDAASSFSYRYRTTSGQLTDDLGMTSSRRGERQTEGRYGAGDGSIDLTTLSGDLHIEKR